MHNQIFSIFRKLFFVGIEPMKLFPLTFLLFCGFLVQAQDTQIRGFVDFGSNYKNDQVNFTLGEQDLFITSEISDRISF